MTRKCLGSALAVLVVLGVSRLASAAVIAGAMHENFNYPAATEFINASTLNGGQGWNATGTTATNDATANWGIRLNGGAATARTATSPGLTSTATGYLAASGNKLTLDGTSAVQNTGRLLGTQVIDSGTTYFSVLMSRSNDTIRTINLALFGGTTAAADGNERLAIGQIGATAGNSGGAITMLFNNQNPAGMIAPPAIPVLMGTNTTHLIIGKIEWNATGFETVSLWVDPTNVTTEGAAGAVYLSSNAFELTSINAIRPFAGNSATVGGNTVPGAIGNFDEFRIGGTWASVTTAAVPVPEPGSASLAVLLGLALAVGRRKN